MKFILDSVDIVKKKISHGMNKKLGVSKKTEKLIKLRKQKKKLKKPNREKKPIKILKKPTDLVL
jgi:hypothetical protein